MPAKESILVFTSLSFLLLFLMPVLGVYHLLPTRWRNGWLLAASLTFYLIGNPSYFGLFVAVIIWSWAFGRAIDRAEGARRKTLLLVCVAAELGVLAFFKYAGYTATLVQERTGETIALANLALPIGISFYSFQAISYAIDVYRGMPAQQSLVAYGTYLSFFPQLIAGPIVRYTEVAPRLAERSTTLDDFSSGVLRFSVGLCKKVLLANMLGQLADHVFDSPQIAQMSTWTLWLATLAYTLQVYYDFSGYSDMAIGLGALFGFHLPENFKYPYAAGTATEFWRRWHMTLSRWFRDYVYIPLGGNRRGAARQCLNLMVVWGLTGIWHGAGGTFLTWGLLWGLLLMAEKFLIRPTERGRLFQRIYRVFIIVWIMLLWVIFRSPNLATAGTVILGLFRFQTAQGRPYELALWVHDLWPYLLAGTLLCTGIVSRAGAYVKERASAPAANLLYAGYLLVMLLLTCLAFSFLSISAYNPFLYFNF